MFKTLKSYKPFSLDLGLLILRVGCALLLITHGWPKLSGFTQKMNSFADPFGIGSAPSLALALFAEFFCAIFLTIGLFTRFALIPMIITMLTIVFIVHGSDPFAKKEMGLLYLIPFIALFFTGPGKFSVDGSRG